MTNIRIKETFIECDDTMIVGTELEIGVNKDNYLFISISYPDDSDADCRVITLNHETAKHLLKRLKELIPEVVHG